MLCYVILLAFVGCMKTTAQVNWVRIDAVRGNYSFAMPEKPILHDTANVVFYYLDIDGIVMQVYYGDSVQLKTNVLTDELLQSNGGDELRAQAQLMQVLNKGELVSIKDIEMPIFSRTRGLDFGFKYFLGETQAYTFCRIYRWKSGALYFTVTADIYSLDKLIAYKLDFFDSITFK